MQKFYDYDIENPFDIVDEKHVIKDNKIVLDYIPLEGSVIIAGFAESNGASIGKNEFFVDYSTNTKYRMATGTVLFGDNNEGLEVGVTYKGVSTLIKAKHMNEIKEFMENCKADIILSRGEQNAITDKETEEGLTIAKVNNNGYSIPSGNVLTLGGDCGGQIAVGSDSEGNSIVCFRVRATNSDKWSPWLNLSSISYVNQRIEDIIGSAPESLDTLQELSNSLGDNPDFAGTVTNMLAGKLDKAGGTITGDLTVEGNINGNVNGDVTGSSGSCTGNAKTATTAASCTGNAATATKATGDKNGKDITTTYLPLAGGTLTGSVSIKMNGKNVTFINSGYTKGTAPSANAYSYQEYTDVSGSRMGWIGQYYNATANYVNLSVRHPDSGNNTEYSMGIAANSSGCFTYAPTPATEDNSTKIATTAYVKAQGYITSSGSITGSSGSCTGNAATATTAKNIPTSSGQGNIWIA